LRDLITQRFQGQFQCEIALNGQEAMEILQELKQENQKLCLIICDQIMPGIPGDEFLIQAHHLFPEAVKILLTGQAGLDPVVNAINHANLYRYISKPWEDYDFSLTIAQGIEKYNFISSLEEKVSQRTAALENANQELEQFAYIVAHDLKSPLASIHQVTQILSDPHIENHKKNELLKMIQKRIEDMNGMIDAILRYSRSKTSQLDNLIVVDLNEIVRDVITVLDIPPHIKVLIKDRLPRVYGEPTQVYQVFQNILGNALKYNDKEQGRIEIAFVVKDSFYQFEIHDNGRGIPAKDHKTIFELFKTLGGKKQGTGVGLAIVKKIVESYGGKVWVESEKGQGATFFFTLPAIA
jgi:signal transduction histidine kinase